MVQLIWSKLAVGELQEKFEYVSKDSKKYAERHVKKIRESTTRLKSSKYIGKVVEEIDVPTIREIIEDNNRII
jgi:plasmid stabilization system protein ParE